MNMPSGRETVPAGVAVVSIGYRRAGLSPQPYTTAPMQLEQEMGEIKLPALATTIRRRGTPKSKRSPPTTGITKATTAASTTSVPGSYRQEAPHHL
jgi:hypothetical protein